VIAAGAGGRLAPPPPALPAVGVGRLRKIALVGTAQTVDYAPWYDPTWEIWSHASSASKWPRVDRSFEMHPECVWRETTHKKQYLKWMQGCQHPLYMLEQFPDIKTSVRYPRERIFGECRAMVGRLHFGSHADFMIALALAEGVTHLGLFGVHYVDPVKDGDRLDQLVAVKFWLGVAAGKGVHLVIPEGNPIFSIPKEVYGLESHSTVEKYRERLKREQAVARKPSRREPVHVEALEPSDGTGLRTLPPTVNLGHKPAPEHWEQFEMVGA
jgi:hypothetical protein